MFELPYKAIKVRDEVEAFFKARVLPNNKLWRDQARAGQSIPDIERQLRTEAQQLGLWNMALPRLADSESGIELSNLGFTGVAELLGRLEWAARVFNCQAPDMPNIELLQLLQRNSNVKTGSIFCLRESSVLPLR